MVYQDGEKMSKSLGNLTLVGDLLKDYDADTIRVTLQNHHYRSPWECFPEDLASARKTVELFRRVRELVGHESACEDAMLLNQFKAAMDNDLGTPEALRLLHNASEAALAEHKTETAAQVLRLTAVLGLRL
jgi:cysteinyl-tRNA synthetase